jgi:hypothetical protein
MSGETVVELDAELKSLSLMAIDFISSQGIVTAKAFISANTTTTSNALVEWRKRSDSKECSIEAARNCISTWAVKLRRRRSRRSGEAVVEPNAEQLNTDTAVGKTTEGDDDASNDCFSHHHGDSKVAEPRDERNEQKLNSKRKRPPDEWSPNQYPVLWV